MLKNCAESSNTFFDLLINPNKSIIIKDKKGNEYELKENNILFIECKKSNKNDKDNRDIKIVHLCYPIEINNNKHFLIEWRTKLTLAEIIEKLGFHVFLQISKTTIVRSVTIQGRDSSWKYIQLIGYNSIEILNPEKYITKELPIGRKFKDVIKKTIEALNLIEIKNYHGNDVPDLIYINPINIIFIEITKEVKIIHSINPYSLGNRNHFEVIWNSRLSAEEMINYFKVNSLVQVNRNIIINLYYVVGDFDSYQNLVTVRYNNLIENTFKVGKNYYQKILTPD